MTNTTRIAVPLVASALHCGTILAADDCTGYEVLVTQKAETSDVGNGQILTLVTQSSVLFSEDAPIYNFFSGVCQASVLTTPDGKMFASGHCARRDKDGDTQSLEWSHVPGTQRNVWKTVAGTGKFAGKSGSGWGEVVHTDGKIIVERWGGHCG